MNILGSDDMSELYAVTTTSMLPFGLTLVTLIVFIAAIVSISGQSKLEKAGLVVVLAFGLWFGYTIKALIWQGVLFIIAGMPYSLLPLGILVILVIHSISTAKEERDLRVFGLIMLLATTSAGVTASMFK